MSVRVIAQRYAEALLAAAQEESVVEAVESDLKALTEALETGAFSELFYHGQLKAGEKEKLLTPLLERLLTTPLARNFVFLLWRKQRIILLPAIVNHFRASLREIRGQVLAEVSAVRLLEPTELEAIAEQVKTLTAATEVEFVTKVDKTLLGGLVLRVGDKVYDGSLARRLQDLRNRIRGARVQQSGVNS